MWNRGQIGEVRLATRLKGTLNFLAGPYDENTVLSPGSSEVLRAGRQQLESAGTLNVCDQNADGVVDGTNVTLDERRRTHSDAVNNYEVGAKVTLFNRLSIEAALFGCDWQ